MMNLSVIIPNLNCVYLTKTIEDILAKSETDIEIIVHVDGKKPDKLVEDKRVRYIFPDKPRGMRGGINEGLKIATGKFVMKCDDHCIFGQGFDKILSEDCKENWLMTPRRYSLDVENWKRNEARPIRDYLYLSFPQSSNYGTGIFPAEWEGKEGSEIDDTMVLQGSCWFANRKYFMERVGFLDDRRETYGIFAQEPVEICLKYWLGGGEVKVDKRTWYAHFKKTKIYYQRGNVIEKRLKKDNHAERNNTWSAKHWMNNEEPNMVHKFHWLIEKFWPVPGWPEDRSLWKI